MSEKTHPPVSVLCICVCICICICICTCNCTCICTLARYCHPLHPPPHPLARRRGSARGPGESPGQPGMWPPADPRAGRHGPQPRPPPPASWGRPSGMHTALACWHKGGDWGSGSSSHTAVSPCVTVTEDKSVKGSWQSCPPGLPPYLLSSVLRLRWGGWGCGGVWGGGTPPCPLQTLGESPYWKGKP